MVSRAFSQPALIGPGHNAHGALGTELIDRIGNTPLLSLHRLGQDWPGVQVLVKAEWFNPGGSIKDRAARRIVLDAEARGLLGQGRILIDSSSGNTAIAYAMLGASRGFQVHICLPANANAERKQLLQAYGAHVILTDPLEGSDGAIKRVREIVSAEPARYFYADQYSNQSNWRAHFESTGPELVAQTRGQITHLVAGLGTTGTLMGTGRYLKRFNPGIQIIAVQPDSPFHGLEGLKHMETALVPGIYDPTLQDRLLEVNTEDAQALTRRLAREEGLLVGVSAGAAIHAALELGREIHARGGAATIVAIAPDGGSRYLSENWWHAP